MRLTLRANGELLNFTDNWFAEVDSCIQKILAYVFGITFKERNECMKSLKQNELTKGMYK